MNSSDEIARSNLQELALCWTRNMWLAKLWKQSNWLGIPIKQWPTDLLIFQEIVAKQRPRVIIETGTAQGGSAYFFACMLALTGGGHVISIDIERDEAALREVLSRKVHAKISFLTGDSKSPSMLPRVQRLVGREKNAMVLLDSNHSYQHVKAELEIYHQFVPPQGHLIVADTICQELAKLPGYEHFLQDNPLRATDEFLASNKNFIRDSSWEKFMVTFCPGGFLRRIR